MILLQLNVSNRVFRAVEHIKAELHLQEPLLHVFMHAPADKEECVMLRKLPQEADDLLAWPHVQLHTCNIFNFKQ
jgi:hypothetical protein